MVRIIIFAALISVALTIYTLIECARSEARDVRSLPKPAWFAVLIFLPLVGAALWFSLGRPLSAQYNNVPTTKAPDDDEDFLRQLEVWRRQQQREAELNQREEQLKRLEEEQKKNSADKPTQDSNDHKKKSDGNGASAPEA